jgi:hypothetical protein
MARDGRAILSIFMQLITRIDRRQSDLPASMFIRIEFNIALLPRLYRSSAFGSAGASPSQMQMDGMNSVLSVPLLISLNRFSSA